MLAGHFFFNSNIPLVSSQSQLIFPKSISNGQVPFSLRDEAQQRPTLRNTTGRYLCSSYGVFPFDQTAIDFRVFFPNLIQNVGDILSPNNCKFPI